MSRYSYITTFFNGQEIVCSRHKTRKAAFAEAAHCEKRGGATHAIYRTLEIRRTEVKKRR